MTPAVRKFLLRFRRVTLLIILAVLSGCSLPGTILSQINSALNTASAAPGGTVPVTSGTIEPTLESTLQDLCPSGNCAYACVSKLKSFLDSPGQPLSPPKSVYPRNSRQVDAITLVTYHIDGNQIDSPQFASGLAADLLPYQQDSQAQHKIWDYYSRIIPADERKDLTTFTIATDGKGGMLASVGITSADTSHWTLSVDIVDATDPTDMTYTLLHEFGHLLTLNSTQVTMDMAVLTHPDDPTIFSQESSACPTYFSSEGCTKPDSYLNQFFQRFWVKIYSSWQKINAEKNSAVYNEELAKFYMEHQSDFVTPYAVTSPEEDIAESWAHFLFGPKPSGDSIANQKLLFFYGFSNLVQLREQIVNGICNYSEGK